MSPSPLPDLVLHFFSLSSFPAVRRSLALVWNWPAFKSSLPSCLLCGLKKIIKLALSLSVLSKKIQRTLALQGCMEIEKMWNTWQTLVLKVRVSQPQHFWYFGQKICCGDCPVHFRMFMSILDLCKPDASGTHSLLDRDLQFTCLHLCLPLSGK